MFTDAIANFGGEWVCHNRIERGSIEKLAKVLAAEVLAAEVLAGITEK
jgi:hypothetical protein